MKSDKVGERYIVSAANLEYKEVFEKIANSLNVNSPKYRANKFLIEIVWRLAALVSFFTKKQAKITKESARSATAYSRYSSQKLIDQFDYNFIDIDDSISYIASVYNSKVL